MRDYAQSIQTFTGRIVYPLNPLPEDIFIEDIAHSLSNMCRFTGHTSRFYSVADHSIRVSQVVPTHDALWGLLHDASEAYLTDIPRPLKRVTGFGDQYRAFERVLMAAICRRFGLPEKEPESVHVADMILLMTEKRDLMSGAERPWDEDHTLPEPISPLSPAAAERAFLARFEMLTEKV
jgi:hypothetical protein